MKTDHTNRPPGQLALCLGIVGLISSTALCILFGWVLGVFSVAVSLFAVILGVITRKVTEKKHGRGAVICGIISIVMAVAITTVLCVGSDEIGRIAENKGFSRVARHARALSNGIIGMMLEIRADEEDTDSVLRELDELHRISNP